MKRILFTGGGGAGSEALWRLYGDRYELYFADAVVAGIDIRIPADRRVRIPFAHDAEFCTELEQCCQDLRIDLIVPGVDEELPILAGKKTLGSGTSILLAQAEFVRCMQDKFEGARAIRQAGLSAPDTICSDTKPDFSFPMVIKPRMGRGSRGVMMIDRKEQIAAYLALYGREPGQVILQEFIMGQEYTVFVCGDGDGNLRAVVPVRVEEKRGITLRAETRRSAAIESYARRFQAAFRVEGPYNIQCVLTREDVVFPFEVNPRVSTTLCLCAAAGVDVIALFADREPGRGDTDELVYYREGVRLMRNWKNEFAVAP